MDFHPLNLLLTAALSKTNNEQDHTETSRDTNNNHNKNYNINNGIFDGTSNFKSTASNNLLLACNRGLMSQSGRDKTRIENNSSDSITRATETFTNVTSDPVCDSAFREVESQSPSRVSPISESAITDRSGTTESQSYITKATIPTTTTDSDINGAHTATRSALIPTVNQIGVETSCNDNNTNYIKNNNKNNNNNKDCSVDIENTKFQLPSLPKEHHQEKKVASKPEKTSPTTNKSHSLVVGDPSNSSSSYPDTKGAEIETPDCRAAANRITEQDATKTAVIAPLQEYSVVQVPSPAPTLDSSVPSPSVALAVAPVTPRTTEGNYGASSSNKTRGISSVCSGSEHHQTGSPASSEADTATTTPTTTTTTTSTTAKTTITTTAAAACGSVITGTTTTTTTTTTKDDNKVGGKSNNVNNSSGSGEVERDPDGQKLVISGASDACEGGSLRGGAPHAAEAAAAVGQQDGNKNSKIISELDKDEEEKQQKHQQQLLSLNKREGEEEVDKDVSEWKEKEDKEVLESVTLPSPPPPSSTSLLPPPLPLAQEGERIQSAPAAAVTTTATITTASTDSNIGRSSSGRTDEDNDDNSVTRTNEVVASRPDPESDQIVPYCNPASSFSSCIPSTSITASFIRTPPSSTQQQQQQPSQSSSSSPQPSLLNDSNEQPLKLSLITSPKHGLVCIAEAPPATSTVHGSDNNTATATAAKSFDTITVQERRTESLADTMCGPSEDKIMPNSSGETCGLATDEKHEDNTGTQDPDTTTTSTTKITLTKAAAPTKTTATANQANSPVTKPTVLTLSSLTNNYKAATASVVTATTSATAMNLSQADVKNTSSHVRNPIDPNVDQTLKKEELVATALPSSNKNPSIATSSSQSLHESSPSQPPSISSFSSISSSSSSTLLPPLPQPTSPPLASIPAIQRNGNTIPIIQDYLPKISSIVINNAKSLAKIAPAINTAPLKEGSPASVSSNPRDGSEDSTSSQSSPKPGVDSPDSFVALPQTGFESNELEETTEDSNSNNGTHDGAGSACSISKHPDCAFDHNISSVLERRHKSLVSENTCDMEYDRVKPSEKTYFKDDTSSTLSRDFRFGSNVYRKIYGPFESGYNCTFSMQNKNIAQLLETSGSKIGSTSSEFDTDLLRCTTAIADDHSYCWSVSKTQDSESLLRDAHPCDDEISDSSSQDGIPDTQESISFLGQNTFSRSSKIQNPKTTLTLGGSEKSRKATGSATTPPKTNVFTSNSATKFLADLPRSGQEVNSKPHRFFDQRSGEDRKVSAPIPITPVKFTEGNSVSLTSPKITPGGLNSRRSLPASPKVGCFRIGRFASISNIEWDENSDTSSSVGSISLSDKPLEKFTYCRKVDFTDKNLTSVGEPCPKSDYGELGAGKHHSVDDIGAKMVHILHDHDYCMRTTISPMKSELAKELLSGTKHVSGSSKFSSINLQKSSTLSSNCLTDSSASSSSSSSSPHSASYSGSTPLVMPSSSTEAKSLRKSRNNSNTKFVGSSGDPLQESSSAEKIEDSSKLSDPNSEAARTNESKLKITGSFQNDYVYYLNKTTRSRRRFSHEILPDKNLQARNYSDIVIPHLTDADIEALKEKRRNLINNQTVDLPIWKSSQDPPGEVESDNRLINSVLSMENLCPDPVTENVLPELTDNAVVPDNLAANPEQYLTPEEIDILFKAVEEVESTNFTGMDEIPKGTDSYEDTHKQLSPASMLREGNPSLADSGDPPKVTSDKSDISTTAMSQTACNPVSQWTGCNSPAGDLTKQEVLTTDNNLLDLDNIPISDINPMIGNNTDKIKLSCPSGSDLPPSDLSTLCANNSNSSLTDENMPSLEKFVLFNLKSDLFPEPAVTETPVSEGHAPWIVTVTMFWNDLPAIMIDNQPYIRLVDIHKQILPAKDTGILKKRCQLLSLEVLNCTEFQRYFLVQYGRAYNSKSTLVISKDDAKILIGYYVNPPTRIPKGEGCEDEPVSPVKRITKTNGSLERRIKKHGRLIGSRKHKLNKHRINCEKSALEAQPLQQPHPQDEQQQQGQQPSIEQLTSRPSQLKVKGVTKERLVFSSSVNGKSRLRHKKINFLNLIRGETGTASSTSSSSPAATITTAAATIASATSESTLSMLDFVDPREGDNPDNAPLTAKQAKSVVDIKCKKFKSRVSASQKVNGGREQGLTTTMPVRDNVGCQEEDCKFKPCNNGRVGLLSVADGDAEAQAQKKQRNNNNPKQFSAFSAVSNKLPSASKWKNSRNGRGLGSHNNKSNHLKIKLKSRSVTTPDAVTSYEERSNKIQNLSVYHSDTAPESDKKPYMQPGKLFLSLYSAKNAKCIKCTTCAKVFSVDEFLLHQHVNPNTNSRLVVVSTAQSLRLRDDSNKSHQLSWENFTVKHELFEMEGLEDSRLSPLLTTAVGGVTGPVSSTTKSTAVPTVAAVLGAPATECNGSGQKSNSTYRVSSRKRKQKQFYPIENYDFKNMPGSAAHMFGQCGGKARGANGQSVGCSPSKKALMHSVSRSFPSYGLNAPSSSEGGSSLSENVVTLTNEPELLNFTALENDEYM